MFTCLARCRNANWSTLKMINRLTRHYSFTDFEVNTTAFPYFSQKQVLTIALGAAQFAFLTTEGKFIHNEPETVSSSKTTVAFPPQKTKPCAPKIVGSCRAFRSEEHTSELQSLM